MPKISNKNRNALLVVFGILMIVGGLGSYLTSPDTMDVVALIVGVVVVGKGLKKLVGK